MVEFDVALLSNPLTLSELYPRRAEVDRQTSYYNVYNVYARPHFKVTSRITVSKKFYIKHRRHIFEKAFQVFLTSKTSSKLKLIVGEFFDKQFL